MVSHLISTYLFLAASIVLLAAAFLSPHEESIMDIAFLGLSFFTTAVTIKMFRRHREEKRLTSH